MSGRGRGRGRGRGKSFTNSDQPSIIPLEKIQSAYTTTTYPTLEQFPAPLINSTDYDELNAIHNQLLSHFQSSNYHLKLEDENVRLFASHGEVPSSKKVSLNFDWDYFPLELRPVSRRRQKDDSEILESWRRSNMVSMDLSWLDKLEEKEKIDGNTVTVKEEPLKTEPALPDEEEVEEFDDEEMDVDGDYNTNYFDNGEGYLDEDDDLDEPCY